MRRLIIRKPPMYAGMREANYSPGVAATMVITFLLFLAYFVIREIPAELIDTIHYLSHPAKNMQEAKQAINDYVTAPGTMLVSLSMTAILAAIVIVYVLRVEKRPLSTIGITRYRLPRRFAFGYLVGALTLASGVVWRIAAQGFTFTWFNPVALLFIPAFIVQASSIEVLFMGYLLSNLAGKTGVVRAVLLASAMFALLQIDSHEDAFHISEMFLSGVLYAFLTVRTNSIWAACGAHAAYNFTLSLIKPVVYGGLVTDHTVVVFNPNASVIDLGVIADSYILPLMVLDIVLIVLVLFAGKTRIAVRPNETEQMYYRALRIARKALRQCKDDFGKPYIRHSVCVSQMLDGKETIAPLLADACNQGGIPFESLSGFSDDVLSIVRMLIRRDETDLEYVTRVKADPSALAVFRVQKDYEEKLLIEKTRWNKRHGRNRNQGYRTCPLLRRDIHHEACTDIVRMVDEYTDDEANELLRHLDRRICMQCLMRDNRRGDY